MRPIELEKIEMLDEVGKPLRAGDAGDALKMKLKGFVSEQQPFHRNVVYEDLNETIPSSQRLKVQMYTAEMRPGAVSGWHVHHGPLFFVMLEGRAVVESEEREVEYRAGDAFEEPVGVIHRAFNPDKRQSMIAVCFQVTPEDAEHAEYISGRTTHGRKP